MKGRKMDFKNLNTFIQVAEVGSFTRAGEILGYSQPTVSFQIKQLETELGVQLFERIGHTVSLTDDGKEALLLAQNICRMTDEMTSGISKREGVEGNVRLAMADSLCTPLVLGGFAEFKKIYPHINIKITTGGTAEMFRLLEHNEVDLVCTLDSHIYSADYVVVNEKKINVNFICSQNNPITKKKNLSIDDLLKEPFLLTEKGMSYRRLLDERLVQNGKELTPALEIGSVDILCRLVAENTGVSLLPDYVVDNAPKTHEIVKLDVKGFEFEVWQQLIYHKNKWMSPQLKAVIEYLSRPEVW